MKTQVLRVPALDLVLDPSRRLVTRGKRKPIDLVGPRQPWRVLEELANRFDCPCSKSELWQAAWGAHDPACEKMCENTIYVTIWKLCKLLRPLGVTVICMRDLGYVLKAGKKKAGRPRRQRQKGRLPPGRQRGPKGKTQLSRASSGRKGSRG